MKGMFLKGTLTLLLSSLLSRVMGFVYRIYIIRLIGAEGIGLYEMIFPIITFILVITTAGIPVAIAKLVATNFAQKHYSTVTTIFRLALLLLAFTGVLLPALLVHVAPWFLGKIFPDPRAYWPFMALIPTIFFVSISSVFRGYYQGINNMLPSALSQLSEQIVRILVGFILVPWLLLHGIEFAAAGLSLAVLVGEITGLTMLLLFYRRTLAGYEQPIEVNDKPLFKPIIGQIFTLAIPVTMSRVISSLALSIKAVVIPARLQYWGYSLQEATQAYGAFSGMAMSLISFPTVITVSLSSVLLPTIATAIAAGQFEQLNFRINQGVKLTVLASLPFAIWFFWLARPLTAFLFKSQEAGIPLKFLAPACIFIYLQQTTAGILYGLGKMRNIFFNSFVGYSITLFATYLLVGIPPLGIGGASLGTFFGAATTCLMNLQTLKNYPSVRFNVKNWVIPAALSALICIFIVTLLRERWSLVTILLASGSIYLGLLFALGGLGWADLGKR